MPWFVCCVREARMSNVCCVMRCVFDVCLIRRCPRCLARPDSQRGHILPQRRLSSTVQTVVSTYYVGTHFLLFSVVIFITFLFITFSAVLCCYRRTTLSANKARLSVLLGCLSVLLGCLSLVSCVMCYVWWSLVNRCTTVWKIAFEKACNEWTT